MFGEVTYTSNVFFGVAFDSADEMREVLAVYAMLPRVQKFNIMSKWNLRFDGAVPLMFYKEDGVSWHLGFKGWESALKEIENVAGEFYGNRGLKYGWYFLRAGEHYSDVDEASGGTSMDLTSYIAKAVQFNRSIEVDL